MLARHGTYQVSPYDFSALATLFVFFPLLSLSHFLSPFRLQDLQIDKPEIEMHSSRQRSSLVGGRGEIFHRNSKPHSQWTTKKENKRQEQHNRRSTHRKINKNSKNKKKRKENKIFNNLTSVSTIPTPSSSPTVTPSATVDEACSEQDATTSRRLTCSQ